MKKVIAFDLDDTLAITKSPISDRISELLGRLLEKYDICVISGGRFEQFEKQVVERLDVPKHLANKLHMMPTCGTRYYRFNELEDSWKLQYAEDIDPKDRARIVEVLEEEARALGIWVENPVGEIIEDRYSQITLSALGQYAKPEDKYAWSEANKDLRPVFRDKVAIRLPEFEVRLGGTTSTDITLPGIDKSAAEAIGVSKEEILFIGDKLQEGGNDYPVKAMGIDTIEVRHWEDTAYVLEGILGVSD